MEEGTASTPNASELPRTRRLNRRLELTAALLFGLGFPAHLLVPPHRPVSPAHLPPQLQPPAGARLEELSLVDLRQIRGVGPARARAIRQSLWRRGAVGREGAAGRPGAKRGGGGLEALKEIPGVGDKTAARIEGWLAARGLPPATRRSEEPLPGLSPPDLHPSEPRKSPRSHRSE